MVYRGHLKNMGPGTDGAGPESPNAHAPLEKVQYNGAQATRDDRGTLAFSDPSLYSAGLVGISKDKQTIYFGLIMGPEGYYERADYAFRANGENALPTHHPVHQDAPPFEQVQPHVKQVLDKGIAILNSGQYQKLERHPPLDGFATQQLEMLKKRPIYPH